MGQRIHNLAKWTFLEEGSALHYANPRRRTVILEVNSPDEVCYYVQQDLEDVRDNPERVVDRLAGRTREGPPPEEADQELSSRSPDRAVSFLGVAKGRDRFEFAVDGAFSLLVDGGSTYVYTADSQDIATRIVAPVIFTRIANRRARNPELERMQFMMRVNQQRMFDELNAEMDRRTAALKQELETYAPDRYQGTVVKDGRRNEPEQADNEQSSVEDTGKVGSDDEKKTSGSKRVKVEPAPKIDHDH